MKTSIRKKYSALSLVEILVAITVMAIIVGSGYQVFQLSLNATERAKQFTIAEMLTMDLIELTIAKRNENWNSLGEGEYYLAEDPDPNLGFVFVQGEETVDEFTRSIVISAVQRDSSGEIVSSGGTLDPNTFHLLARTSWQSDGNNFEVELEQYVTNWGGF